MFAAMPFAIIASVIAVIAPWNINGAMERRIINRETLNNKSIWNHTKASSTNKGLFIRIPPIREHLGTFNVRISWKKHCHMSRDGFLCTVCTFCCPLCKFCPQYVNNICLPLAMNHLLCSTIEQETGKNINVSQSFMSRGVLWSEWKLFNLFATLEFFSENFLGHLNFWKDGVFPLNFQHLQPGLVSDQWSCVDWDNTLSVYK